MIYCNLRMFFVFKQAGSEVEECFKRIHSHKGVIGYIVLNSDGKENLFKIRYNIWTNENNF